MRITSWETDQKIKAAPLWLLVRMHSILWLAGCVYFLYYGHRSGREDNGWMYAAVCAAMFIWTESRRGD